MCLPGSESPSSPPLQVLQGHVLAWRREPFQGEKDQKLIGTFVALRAATKREGLIKVRV